MGTRGRVAGLVGLGLVACVAIGAVVVRRAPAKSYVCAGVGLRAPSASTPEGALAALLAIKGGHANDWARGDHRTVGPGGTSAAAAVETYDFTPKHPVATPNFTRIVIGNRTGRWSAIGACVAEPVASG